VYSLFTAHVSRFYKCHASRQGIAVLAFDVESVDMIHVQYILLHPTLVVSGPHDYDTAKVLEVFAYYDKEKKEADEGTILRFVEKVPGKELCVLPGLVPVHAAFDQPSLAAYCDHWVSNVHSRTGFLTTLQDTLGFTPKVDFNAGVVAAGEAQIESTVTGNESPAVAKEFALRNQSQVYLPINNALSDVGHVHGFLNEIGQGIQHVASRVENLVDFVQQANDWRKITGEGFSFLGIPRSYYGILTVQQLVDKEVSLELAECILQACQSTQVVSSSGAVDLDLNALEIEERLQSSLEGTPHLEEYTKNKECIVATIIRSRYINLHSLLKDHISESSYLGIVRNQILVDVQSDDLLYQIFTSNILQRKAGEEAPFLEFIQRVCSECPDTDESDCPVKIKPGCGGFGIRNFLTLFLSIELSKAMLEVSEAKVRGDEERQAVAQAMVDCFTDQLNESNPILTEISNAMTRERHCQDMLTQKDGDAELWSEQLEQASQVKTKGNQKLMDCSTKYKERMVALRQRN
jgi:4-hydroxyphenylpyruvate dioxygenase-like putative hemolysin